MRDDGNHSDIRHAAGGPVIHGIHDLFYSHLCCLLGSFLPRWLTFSQEEEGTWYQQH